MATLERNVFPFHYKRCCPILHHAKLHHFK